jgi:hypothetical protein
MTARYIVDVACLPAYASALVREMRSDDEQFSNGNDVVLGGAAAETGSAPTNAVLATCICKLLHAPAEARSRNTSLQIEICDVETHFRKTEESSWQHPCISSVVRIHRIRIPARISVRIRNVGRPPCLVSATCIENDKLICRMPINEVIPLQHASLSGNTRSILVLIPSTSETTAPMTQLTELGLRTLD